jgi:hypothetical protein
MLFDALAGILGQSRDAQELQPQTVHAIEDAEQVRLVFELSGAYRPPVFALYAHPLKGTSIPVAELATHH